jgi:hypothetical protein
VNVIAIEIVQPSRRADSFVRPHEFVAVRAQFMAHSLLDARASD